MRRKDVLRRDALRGNKIEMELIEVFSVAGLLRMHRASVWRDSGLHRRRRGRRPRSPRRGLDLRDWAAWRDREEMCGRRAGNRGQRAVGRWSRRSVEDELARCATGGGLARRIRHDYMEVVGMDWRRDLGEMRRRRTMVWRARRRQDRARRQRRGARLKGGNIMGKMNRTRVAVGNLVVDAHVEAEIWTGWVSDAETHVVLRVSVWEHHVEDDGVVGVSVGSQETLCSARYNILGL